MYMVSNDKNARNIQLVVEDDFSTVPEGTLIWDGTLPFKQGSKFPTEFIQERANIFKTNDLLYEQKAYDSIFSNIINFNEMLRDAVTNYPILRLIPNLPDYRLVTDTWVDLLGAKSPKIDGTDVAVMSKVSSIVDNSNFAIAFQQAVRGSLLMYGNAVYRVDKQAGGKTKVIEMPIKTWIPLVNEQDITTIDVNCFFNIYKTDRDYCEFILYHEDGRVEKYTHLYNKASKVLGELVDYEEDVAFGGKGVSPIVVFTGQRLGNTVYGTDSYRKWESSIIACMKAFETILVLLQRTKEIYRLMPEGATQRDENTGITFMQQTGAIMYKHEREGNVPEVKMVVPSVPMEEAIRGYKEAVIRVSRDTDLTYTMFDTKELGTNMTGKALKTAMYRTELKAKSWSTLINNSAKDIVIKMALASGIEISGSDFTLISESGFVNDIETLTELVQKRNGGATTLTVQDSIALLDDVSMTVAEERARELKGLQPLEKEEINISDSGDDSIVSDVTLTTVSAQGDDSLGKQPVKAYPLGGDNING